MSTLYEKFGGEETIAKVVDYFYDLVLADNTAELLFQEYGHGKATTASNKIY